MSNYEVNLVNDNMQEFHVKFHGPSDSITFIVMLYIISNNQLSPFPRRIMENSC